MIEIYLCVSKKSYIVPKCNYISFNVPINTNNPPNINANAENARATLSSVDRVVCSKHHNPIDVLFDDSLIKSHDIVAAIPNPNATTPRTTGTPYEHLLWAINTICEQIKKVRWCQ